MIVLRKRFSTIQHPLLDELRWIAGDDGLGGDIFRLNRTGGYNRIFTNRNT